MAQPWWSSSEQWGKRLYDRLIMIVECSYNQSVKRRAESYSQWMHRLENHFLNSPVIFLSILWDRESEGVSCRLVFNTSSALRLFCVKYLVRSLSALVECWRYEFGRWFERAFSLELGVCPGVVGRMKILLAYCEGVGAGSGRVFPTPAAMMSCKRCLALSLLR